uniref:Fork-head domain-containing protein n=1 Tax=Trichuris muris TaxID=70415 RepID=A0A5S6QWT6_TRIMR
MDERSEGRSQAPPLLDSMSLSSLGDLSCYAGNSSFDVGSNSEDSFGWYRKADADRFKEMTGGEDVFNFVGDGGALGEPPSPYLLNGCLNGTHSPPSAEGAREWTSNGGGFPESNGFSLPQPSCSQELSKVEQQSTSSVLKYPKPPYSYSCMIALALKNSATGCLRVSEIYDFIIENFPFFVNAPSGWKNSVRHNLSLNKSFVKLELQNPQRRGRKCCLWSLNRKKISKIDGEIQRVREKDGEGIKDSLANPGDLDLIENGLKGMPRTVKARSAEARIYLKQANQACSPATIQCAESPRSASYRSYTNILTNQLSENQSIPCWLAVQSGAAPTRYELPNAISKEVVPLQHRFQSFNHVSRQLFSNECNRPNSSAASSFPRYNSARSLNWQYDHPVENRQPTVDTFSAPPSVFYSPSKQTVSVTSSPTNSFAGIPYKDAHVGSPSRWPNPYQHGMDVGLSTNAGFLASYQSPF